LFAACPATADTVVLTNGRRLQGRVSEDGQYVTVETQYGSIRLERSRIQTIIKQATPLDEYARRCRDLSARLEAERPAAPDCARLWCELADWCAEQGLARARGECLRKALAADPDCAPAREALGFVRVGDAWVTGDKRWEALGLVQYNGRWITPEARQDAEGAAEEARQRELERAAAEAEVRRKLAEAGKLEAERRLLEIQARRAQEEQTRSDPEWELTRTERAGLLRVRSYVPWPYRYYPWPPVAIWPPLTPPAPGIPVLPFDPLGPARPATTSPSLNSGRSGPGFPVLP
jgi:hypothetical protein